MENKYTPKEDCEAIQTRSNGGFMFGNCMIGLNCDPLNVFDGGYTDLSGNFYHKIEDDS